MLSPIFHDCKNRMQERRVQMEANQDLAESTPDCGLIKSSFKFFFSIPNKKKGGLNGNEDPRRFGSRIERYIEKKERLMRGLEGMVPRREFETCRQQIPPLMEGSVEGRLQHELGIWLL